MRYTRVPWRLRIREEHDLHALKIRRSGNVLEIIQKASVWFHVQNRKRKCPIWPYEGNSKT